MASGDPQGGCAMARYAAAIAPKRDRLPAWSIGRSPIALHWPRAWTFLVWHDRQNRDRDPRRRLFLGSPGVASPARRGDLHARRLRRRREREPDVWQPSRPRGGGRDRLRSRADLLPGDPGVLLS